MSKITFRADEDLVERVEALDASKSEVMREALRAYLDGDSGAGRSRSVDDVLAERVDALVAERLAEFGPASGTRGRDVNVNVTVEPGANAGVDREQANREQVNRDPRRERSGRDDRGRTCGRCGEPVSDDHVYCPNCGEKATNRTFCDCGDELRSDWAYCPGCGRRTPSADVLDG